MSLVDLCLFGNRTAITKETSYQHKQWLFAKIEADVGVLTHFWCFIFSFSAQTNLLHSRNYLHVMRAYFRHGKSDNQWHNDVCIATKSQVLYAINKTHFIVGRYWSREGYGVNEIQ